MPFSKFGLHPDLLLGVKELGFKRPTPIQVDAIPPAVAGKDVLACAMTGSGKSAAFLLPILNRLIGKKRGTTRALILTPTRELAAQIDEHLRDLAVHTPLSGAAIYGGVGMGPQEHAFRSGVDVLVATPGRLLDHFQRPYAKLEGLEILVPQDLKMPLLAALLARGEIRNAIVFTRTKHRANRLFEQLERQKVKVARIHGNRSQVQRTEALAGFKSGRYRILVATDIAARGIDVEALSHVVNFDVPNVPDDYIHRVGRTARAELTGDAITFVAPDVENDLRAIETSIGKRLPRVTVPDFDYAKKPAERLEIPIHERIAAIRAKKAEDRARSKAKAERRASAEAGRGASARRPAAGPPRGARPSGPARPMGAGLRSGTRSTPATSSPSPSRNRGRGRNRP